MLLIEKITKEFLINKEYENSEAGIIYRVVGRELRITTFLVFNRGYHTVSWGATQQQTVL
jgi:hypothetical protein